ncbi:FAD-dependent monooxygenase [Pseudooceanicola sp. C21-150M6]|uniref:FAD-dependent monooxygenase n=1 Tax=Pseudooceanicola sp. C21-150M6 TaxID=3434355 RepID=UPI003D7FFB9B
MGLADRSIIVIGAGIGGLAVARALALRGAAVTLMEQAPEITEVGAGIQIGPNGFAVLRGLGLERPFREGARAAVQAKGVTLRDRHGLRVARLRFDGMKRGEDYVFCHRADLIDILADGASAAGVRVMIDTEVTRVDTGPNPAVQTAKGRVIPADLIVCADGLHSRMTPRLNPGSHPHYTGMVAWRAVVPGDEGPHIAQVFMGAGQHIVTYPLRGGKQRNIVAVQERHESMPENWNTHDDPANMRAAFRDMGSRAQTLLSRIKEVHLWGLFRHPVAERWFSDGVVLLGDAAHPTLPFQAQGASMALEDAWVLAEALDEVADQNEALALYQERREARVHRVINAAEKNARRYHLSGPVGDMAHMGLRLVSALAPIALTSSFNWLYNHDVTGGQRLSGSGQASRSTQTGT